MSLKIKVRLIIFWQKIIFELKKYFETLKYIKNVEKNNFYYYDAIFLQGNAYLFFKKYRRSKK